MVPAFPGTLLRVQRRFFRNYAENEPPEPGNAVTGMHEGYNLCSSFVLGMDRLQRSHRGFLLLDHLGADLAAPVHRRKQGVQPRAHDGKQRSKTRGADV